MEDLIKALTILLKYGNPYAPTHCEHDKLTINSDISPVNVSAEDIAELERLGFHVGNDYGDSDDEDADDTIDEDSYFYSYRFGSC